jgi:hypothetical protein
MDGLKGDAGSRVEHDPASSSSGLPQCFGAGAAPPLALQDDLPLLAGAALLAPPALQELLPPPAADGSVAPGVVLPPPPQATVEPISIPATAETARAFAMFMTVVSSLLLEERPGFPAKPRRGR